MKKVIFGGFCLVAGILLFCLSFFISSIDGVDRDIWIFISLFAGVPLAVLGLILGFSGLREDK
jgi:hypothetical protein